MKIIKRSGSEVEFDAKKIVLAVTRANEKVVPSARMTPIQIKRIAEDVESAAENMSRSLSVEEIQDMVEDQIMNQRAFDVARRYITYRYRRAMVRKSNTTDELNSKLFEGRDPNMIAWADNYLKQEGDHTGLMTVGAGHMIGKTGVVQGLKDLGYTVEVVPAP